MKELIGKAILLIIMMMVIYFVATLFRDDGKSYDYPSDIQCDPRTGCW